MRKLTARFALLLVLAGGFAPALSVAEEGDASGRLTLTEPAETREEQLSALFEQLQSPEESRATREAENGILKIWLDSGSPTIDVLMEWTLRAIDEENYPLALDFLDRITSLRPEYVEGWNKRATVFFMIDDYAKALADLERTLALEPRHFGALAGLGQILREIGDERRALDAFRAALELDPHMEGVADAISDIEKESGDQRI